MPYYGPRVTPRHGRERLPSPGESIAGALQGLRRSQLQDEEMDLRREDRDLRREDVDRRSELQELNLALQGVRRGEAPTREVQVPTRDEDPLVQGRNIAEGPGGMIERDDFFDRTGQGQDPFIDALDRVGSGGRAAVQEPRLRHLPGSFVPGVGYTRDPVFDRPEIDTRMGLQRPGTREAEDPRFDQLTDEFYLDTGATPEARRTALDEQRRTPAVEALGRLRNASPDQLAALRAGVDPGLVFEDPDEAGISADDLRSAGVDESLIPAAERDPVLARQLIADTRRSSGADDPGYAARLSALQAKGVTGPEAEAIARDETAYRQYIENQRGPSERDDYVARHQRAFGAAERLQEIRDDFREVLARSGRIRTEGETLGELDQQDLAAYNREVRAALRDYGYSDISEVSADMRAFGRRIEEEAGGGAPEGEPAAGGGSWQARAAELRGQGLSDDEVVSTLREEGLIGG